MMQGHTIPAARLPDNGRQVVAGLGKLHLQGAQPGRLLGGNLEREADG